MLLNILKHPNETLREYCTPVNVLTKKHKKLIKDMVKTMEANDGVGLAAPQVGVTERMIIVKNYKSNEITPMINPVILSKSDKVADSSEGCLSIPGINKMVTRSEDIIVEYLTEKNVYKRERFSSHMAFVIQHEIDHLNGILIIDYPIHT